MLKNSCNYRTKFKWINASSNFAISVHIDQDWDSNPEELILVNFHEVTLFFNNEFAESVGVDPNTFHSTSCFQDSPAGRCSSLSKIDTLGLHLTTLSPLPEYFIIFLKLEWKGFEPSDLLLSFYVGQP